MAYPLFARFSGLRARIAAASVFAAALIAPPAGAFDRPIPPEAKRAEFAVKTYPEVRIDGKTRRLSAGARIRNADNLIVMPGVLGENKYAVRYTEDGQGEIDRVWILTDEEAKRPSPRQP